MNTCYVLRDGKACNIGNDGVEAYWAVVVVESDKSNPVSLFESFVADRDRHNVCITKQLWIIFDYCKVMCRM